MILDGEDVKTVTAARGRLSKELHASTEIQCASHSVAAPKRPSAKVFGGEGRLIDPLNNVSVDLIFVDTNTACVNQLKNV